MGRIAIYFNRTAERQQNRLHAHEIPEERGIWGCCCCSVPCSGSYECARVRVSTRVRSDEQNTEQNSVGDLCLGYALCGKGA